MIIKRNKQIVFIILLLSGAFLMTILFFEYGSRDRYAKKGYTYIGKEQAFNGVVSKALFDRGFHIISLKGYKTPFFLTGGLDLMAKKEEPNNFKRYRLAHFLNVGDSVYKYSKVDTVYVSRENENYSFYIEYYYNPYEEGD